MRVATLWSAGLGWSVTALDFSRVAVERGRQLAAATPPTGSVLFPVADVEREPVPAAELVLLSSLHLPSERRSRLLGAAAAAVVPGGALVLVGHDRRNLVDGVGGPQDPDLLWSPEDVAGPGLDVVVAQTRPRPVGQRTAWDTAALLTRGLPARG